MGQPITPAEREQWRDHAESLAMAYPGTCDDHDYDRILRLLDALKAAEAERDEARAALARAWDEGWDDGYAVGYSDSIDPDAPGMQRHNPYPLAGGGDRG